MEVFYKGYFNFINLQQLGVLIFHLFYSTLVVGYLNILLGAVTSHLFLCRVSSVCNVVLLSRFSLQREMIST